MVNCEECGHNMASVHLTKIENNEVTAVHLCEECAKGKGISIAIDPEKFGLASMPIPMQQAIAAMQPQAPSKPVLVCQSCGTNQDEFDKTGRLGCASCYGAFREQIDKIQLRFSDTLAYKGKMYSRGTCSEDETFLREELCRAVKGENFELAASIRDRIKRIARNPEAN